MKFILLILAVSGVFLISCRKPEEPSAVPSTRHPVELESSRQAANDLKQLQGDLKQMDPEEAKFIAVPNTPPDPNAAESLPKNDSSNTGPDGSPSLPPKEEVRRGTSESDEGNVSTSANKQ